MNKISFETNILPQNEGQYEHINYENDTQLTLSGLFSFHLTVPKNNKFPEPYKKWENQFWEGRALL